MHSDFTQLDDIWMNHEYIDTETGIQKVKFKSSFSPRFYPVYDLVKLGFKKLSLTRFHPAGDWILKVELKLSLSGVLKSKFLKTGI